MSTDYNPHTIEQEAQAFWEKNRCFNVEKKDLHSEKFYNLCAFPYPSGELHVGHVRNYVLGDVIARYQRMCGKQVIYPTGWDAFGLPAENAAIAKGVDPRKWTDANIERMRAQLKRLGVSYDWDRELMTCDPNYYQWEQWLFIKLFEKGLAYRKTSWVNWDPVDQTILANEQVIQGRGWRSNALVERKAIPQWFLKITDYTESLLKDLETLKEWPESVKTMQHHWIGRSEGVMVQFKLNLPNPSTLEVFTTRVDTLMGVTYIAISCEHPLAQAAATKDSTIQAFIDACLTVPTAEAEAAAQEKMGAFTGFYAEHPISKTALPIWIANFVEMDYGTGAVMAVPAHDTRDFEFAKKYQLSIQPVIEPLHTDELHDYTQAAYTKQGKLIHSGAFTGLDTKTATQRMTEHLITHQLGYLKTHYRLKDWGISRQRYWGAPIPIIYCNTCGTVPVPLEDLPIKLPKLDTQERGKAPPPLSQIPEFFETTCPKCQGPARRETDTFDTFVESSWYFLRFLCPHAFEMVTPEAQSWLPVDHYIIGIEHAVLHLLYSRFFYRVLHTLDLLKSAPNIPQEPFKAVLTLGMVLKDGAKMSKSKGNVVNPDTLIDQYGVDTLRLFILFAAPPTQSLEWSDEGLLGGARFLKRLWHFVETHKTWLTTLDITNKPLTTEQKALRTQIHTLLQSALQDYNRYQFNTVIASCMKLLNTLQNALSDLSALDSVERQTWLFIIQEGLSILLRLLAPVVPHITHTLWLKLNQPGIILDAPWPIIDQAALYKKEVSFIIQINGKRRGILTVEANTSSEQLTQIALQSDKIKPYLKKMSVKKTILVPAKPNAPLLMNIVAVEQGA